MYGKIRSRRCLPESGVCSGRSLLELGSTLWSIGERGAGRGSCPGQLLGLAEIAPASC